MSGIPSPADVYTPSPVQVNLVPTYGAYGIGTWISCVLFGCNLMSTSRYYSNFPHDTMWIKGTVGMTQVLNVWYILSQCEMCWGTLVQYWGNTVVLNYANWGWFGAVYAPAFMMVLVHSYFAYRIYVLSGFKKIGIAIGIFVVTLSVVGFGFATWFWSSIVQFRHPSKFTGPYATANETWLILGAIADVIITISMVTLMRRVPVVHPRTQMAMRKWTTLAFETNTVTAVGALIAVGLRTTEDPSKSLVYAAVTLVYVEIYPVSLLAVLNSRLQFVQPDRSRSTLPSSARKSPAAFNTASSGGAQSSGYYKNSLSQPPPTLPPTAAMQLDRQVHVLPEAYQRASSGRTNSDAYMSGGETGSTAFPAYGGDVELGRKTQGYGEGYGEYSYAR